MKKIISLILVLALGFALIACTADDTKSGDAKLTWPTLDKLFVGFSQADLSSTWRTVESDHMQKIADDRGYKIAITNAEGDTERQISDVESLLAQGCNVMVIVAIDADAVQPALDACAKKGVPAIMKARGSNGEPGVDYVTSIMSDFVWEGEQAATWVAAACAEKGITEIKVLEIQGIIGGTDVRDRSAGFHNVADKEGNFEFVAQQTANWSRSEAQEVVQNLIQSTGGDFNVIYCHNDEMALGASLALKAAGLVVGEDVFLLGVDGMIEALDAIKTGDLSASVTCTPKYADLVFDTIEKCIAGETVPTSLAVNDKVIDITNVDEFYELGF